MPLPLEVGDQIEARLVGLLSAQTIINTSHYIVVAKTGAVEFSQRSLLPGLKEVLWTGIGVNPGLRTATSFDYKAIAVTVQRVEPTRYVQSILPIVDESGTVLEQSLPSGVSAVLRRQGLVGTRENYGRIYAAGVPRTYVASSSLNAFGQAAYSGPATLLSVDITAIDPDTGAGITIRPIVKTKTAPLVPFNIQQTSVDPVVRYQRRREVGVGI
jgi:hypothetical protein